MFIVMPLLLAAFSLAGIAVIVQRKMPYLRRLNPDAHPAGESVWHDFFPELVDGIRGIQIAEYKRTILMELEKLLRRIRIVFSAIDRISDSLIRVVRREHQDAAMNQEPVPGHLPAQAGLQGQEISPQFKTRKRSSIVAAEELKRREQELIIAIAQDPKNVARYLELAQVYVNLENFADARESLQTALKLEPGNKEIKERLASLETKVADRA